MNKKMGEAEKEELETDRTAREETDKRGERTPLSVSVK